MTSTKYGILGRSTGVGIRRNDAVGVVQNGDGSFTDFMYRIKNDVPPSELSLDAQMAGVRLLGTTYGNAYFTLNYLFKRTDATSASALVSQLGDPNQVNFGALQPAVLNRAVEQTLTPDLNGNGIPDGQEQQIENCIMSKSPTGTPPGLCRTSGFTPCCPVLVRSSSTLTASTQPSVFLATIGMAR